jgi:hypothetical protein
MWCGVCGALLWPVFVPACQHFGCPRVTWDVTHTHIYLDAHCVTPADAAGVRTCTVCTHASAASAVLRAHGCPAQPHTWPACTHAARQLAAAASAHAAGSLPCTHAHTAHQPHLHTCMLLVRMHTQHAPDELCWGQGVCCCCSQCQRLQPPALHPCSLVFLFPWACQAGARY